MGSGLPASRVEGPTMAQPQQGFVKQRVAAITQMISLQSQAGNLPGSSHLRPATAGRKLRFHPLQKIETSRSVGRGSQGPGSRGRIAARLSTDPRSTPRKKLKEILLQSNSFCSTMWFDTTQKTANSSSLLAGQPREWKPKQRPEVLALALDSLEHKWLLTAAQGDVDNIIRLLDLNPSLLNSKDFVTGFTILHWLAKHGHYESFIQVISHAQKKGHPVDVNIPTVSGGFTPLHLAAQQGHELLIKVLVGAYGADSSLRDHSGYKAWQYLRADAPRELKELAGASEDDLFQLGSHNTNNNSKSSREARAGQDCVDSGAQGNPQRSWSLSTVWDAFARAFAFLRLH